MEAIFFDSELDLVDQYFGPSNITLLCDEQPEDDIFVTHWEPATPSPNEVELQIKDEEDTPVTTVHDVTTGEMSQHGSEGVSTQSKLHNCPKHLIKFLAQALELNSLDKLNLQSIFGDIQPSVRQAIRGLLEILQLSHKGKIKSTSKQLLKIVFENDTELNKKFRLLGNSRIRSVFQNNDRASITSAKTHLRAYAIQRMEECKSSFLEDSRIIRKDINRLYVQIFIQELREGVIKERISKTDKLRIFQSCGNF